jgi:NAD(P)-dependent dehydrogenase (short-subunit alcohol dehydrogenase family)
LYSQWFSIINIQCYFSSVLLVEFYFGVIFIENYEAMVKTKVIVVTGVSSGIGFAIASLFTSKGYTVFGSVRTESDGNRVQRLLGPLYKPLVFDLTDGNAILSAANLVEDFLEGNSLSLLVNNAGIAVSGPLEFVSVEEMNYQLQVNVTGVLKVTQVFLPLLGSRDKSGSSKGKVINISSVSGMFTTPFMGPYCASKHALESLTDAMRREFSLYGIVVISILPGPIDTPIWTKAIAENRNYPDSIYAPFLRVKDQIIKKRSAGALSPVVISELVFKICQSANPKKRYYVGNKFWLIRFFKLLPTSFVDRLILKAMLRG